MGGEAGVHKKTLFVVPFFETPIIEQFQIILNDEGYDIVLQALLKEDQTTYAAVSVLEGMDAFESHMEGNDILKGLGRQCIIVCQKLADLTSNILRQGSVITAHLIGQLLVITHSEPILATIAGTGLQDKVQFLDKLLCQCGTCLVDHHINAAEVVGYRQYKRGYRS